MAQQGNSPRSEAVRSDEGSDDRDMRGRSGQQGGRYRDDFASQQSAFSDRDNQMGSYYTGSDRNYGGGQSNYGSSGARQDWGDRDSSSGGGWQGSPAGYGRDTANFGNRQEPGPSRRQGAEGYGHYGGRGDDGSSWPGNERSYNDRGDGNRGGTWRGRDYEASQGYGARPGEFGNGPLGSGDERQQHWDPDYHQWRGEQMRNLDNDYADWRRDRYKKFSDEFNSWRSNRASTSGEAASGSSGTTETAKGLSAQDPGGGATQKGK